jgi:hypothetical protein
LQIGNIKRTFAAAAGYLREHGESFSISACESADNGSAFSIWIISSSYGLLLPCRHA